jgi:hypothetical protein
MQVHCVPVFHSAYHVCILCMAVPVPPPAAASTPSAIVYPDHPFSIVCANSEWCELFGVVDGSSIENLRGPLSEADRFADLLSALHRRVCLDIDAVAHRHDGAHAPVAFRLRPFLCAAGASGAAAVAHGRVAVLVDAHPLEPFCHAGALLSAAGGAASLQDMVHRLSLADPLPPPPVPPGPAAPPGSESLAEVVVQAPAGAPGVLDPLLAELHREGLVVHWSWARPAPFARPGGGGGCGPCRVRAHLDAVRRRARRAGRCRTGLLCLWLLALAHPPPAAIAPPAAAGVAPAMAAGSECGTDFGFLAGSGAASSAAAR